MRPYFELDRVFRDGIFHAATRLYGITFTERPDLRVDVVSLWNEPNHVAWMSPHEFSAALYRDLYATERLGMGPVGFGLLTTVMALGGLYVREIGGDWGNVGQIVFFAGAVVVLTYWAAEAARLLRR